MKTAQYEIATGRFHDFEKRFKVLIRRADKLGLPVPTYKKLSSVWKDYYKELDHFGNAHWVQGRRPGCQVFKFEFYVVEVSTTPVQILGWDFVGCVEHLEPGKNLVHTWVDDYEAEIEFRICEPTCDHCGYARKRNNTYILREEGTDEIWRVGKTCLQDFLGTHSPGKVAQMATTLCDFRRFSEFEGPSFSSEPVTYDKMWILQVAASVVRDPDGNGAWAYYPKSSPTNVPTVTIIKEYISNYLFGNGEEFKHAAKFFNDKVNRSESVELADKVSEWIPTLTNTNSEYVYSLQTVTSLECGIPVKKLGLVASAVGSYLRAKERELQFKAKAKVGGKSVFIGSKGDKIGRSLTAKDRRAGKQKYPQLNVECIGSREFEGNYGTTTLYTFLSKGGNVLTWFASGPDSYHGIKKGKRYTLVASIKGHKEFGGVNQTQITRVVVKAIATNTNDNNHQLEVVK